MKLEWKKVCMSAVLLLGSGAVLSQGKLSELGCGSLANAYGPFDYRTSQAQLRIVETYHFTARIESLGGDPGGDLDYTLRASPNHHRALMSMMKLGARQKTPKVRGATYSVECYMVRAEAFRPDDAMVKVIFGLFLSQSKRTAEAIEKLEAANRLDRNNANVNYNLGLAYMDVRQYDKALENAHRAYAAGFPLPGLKERLKRAGKWREPDAVVPVSDVAPGAPAAPVEDSVDREEKAAPR